jgi:ATP-binding cassette subfamily C protein LapB
MQRLINSPAFTAKWFWAPILENRWAYAQVALATVMVNIFSLSVSIFVMVVYDRIVPNKAFDSLLALTTGIGLALLLDFIIKHARTAFIEEAGKRVDLAVGRGLFDRIMGMRLDARPGSVGSMASTFREAETLRDFFTSATMATLIDLPFLFLFIWVIWILGGSLAWVPLLSVPIALGATLVLQPFMLSQMNQSLKVAQSKHGVVVEILSGLETIKSLGVVGLMRQRWEESVVNQGTHDRGARMLSSWALSITAFVQQVAQVAIVFYGVYLIDAQAITMGALVAGVMLTGRALAPLAQLANLLVRLTQARAAFTAAHKLMELPSDRPEGAHYTHSGVIKGEIQFDNVTFRYPGQDKPALEGLSFRIQPGERVALLGRIGSGKSTLSKILLGLYAPEKGSVMVDGVDLRQIDPLLLRSQIGTLPQDVWLFTGTVRENIAVGAKDPSNEQIIAAAQISGAHDFLRQHPQGYEMPLGERGEGLSGGQRQSIALARALVSTPPVMLLDEPTSMMDGNTERQVVMGLKEHFSGHTLIVTTHRTSLLALVDRVIVLEGGRIVSDTTTAEFVAATNAAARGQAAPPAQAQIVPAQASPTVHL